MIAARAQTRILLIVEQMEIGNDLADSLDLLGYRVVETFTSAERPLEADFTMEADVVLVDLEVQGLVDPIVIGRRIRKRWSVPTIFLTSDTRQAKRVMRYGDDSVQVMWPFLPCALSDAIEQVLADCVPV